MSSFYTIDYGNQSEFQDEVVLKYLYRGMQSDIITT